MADERQRRVEREAAAGDPAAEARLLLERVRNGELARERLELASYAGYAAAQLALGEERVLGPETVFEWTRGLGRWGNELLVCVVNSAIAFAPQSVKPDGGRAVVAAFSEWVEDPSTANRLRIASANEEIGAAHIGDAFAKLIFLDELVGICHRPSSPALLSRGIAEAIQALGASIPREALFLEIRRAVIELALSRATS